MEESLKKVGFPFLGIYRPGLLFTTRNESRPREKFAQFIMGALSPIIPYKYQGIKTEDVAKFMINTSEKLFKHSNDQQIPISNTYESELMLRTALGKL